MYKVEVTRHAKNILDLLKTLPKLGLEAKCEILNYIHANVSKLEKLPSHKEEHLSELCKVLIDYISGDKENEKLMEICDNLMTYMFENKYLKLNFFQKLLEIDKKRRLMIFLYLETCQDSALKLIIANDSEVLHFLSECMQSVQSSVMPWLAAENAENIQMLLNAERAILPAEEEREEKLVHYALCLLNRIYNIHVTSPEIKADQFNTLFMDKVMTLAYMGHKRQRAMALKLFHQALECSIQCDMQKNCSEAFARYKENLRKKFCPRMKVLVSSTNLDWANQWSYTIQFLNTDLKRTVGVANSLLTVQEKAFKSSDPNVRLNAFICWNLLIDYFALDSKHQPVARHIKVLCIPLNVNNSKIEVITMKKLEVWWHLINFIYNDLNRFTKEILVPFLGFCFGPLGDTPLLSIKMEISPSPGKRFQSTIVAGIDALKQLLVVNQKEFEGHSNVLTERLPRCIDQRIFSQSYKTFIHSTLEALLILQNLSDQDLETRRQTGNMLWMNLMKHIVNSSQDLKENIYKELIIALTEFCQHFSGMSVLETVMLNSILISFSDHVTQINFDDNTLKDLVLLIFSKLNINIMERHHIDAVKKLLIGTIKSKIPQLYNTKTLDIFSSCINKLQSEASIKQNAHTISRLWCIIAELASDYISDVKNINEGNALQHNFKTMSSIVTFPLTHLILPGNADNFSRTVKVWKHLYNDYHTHTGLVLTVKPNEIVIDVMLVIRANFRRDSEHLLFITHCFEHLMNKIYYNYSSVEEIITTTAYIINEITLHCLDKKQTLCIDQSLKAFDAFLKQVEKLEALKIQKFLKVVKSSLISMLKYKGELSIEKEIAALWEKVVNLLRGLEKLLNKELLNEFRDVIVLAARHENDDIITHAFKLLSIENMTETAKELLSRIWSEAQIFAKPEKEIVMEPNKGDKKVTNLNSFLNKKVDTPVPVNNIKKSNARAEIPSDPDTQDFVVINSEYSFDFKRLTEHQKEVLKKRRDDIPALYNDLSQSNSQDSNQMQEWFESRVKQVEESKKDTENVPNQKKIDSKVDNNRVQVNSSLTEKDEIQDISFKEQKEQTDKGTINVAKKLIFEQETDKPEENIVPTSKSTENPKSLKRKGEPNKDDPPQVQRRRITEGSVGESEKCSREMQRLKIDMAFDDILVDSRKSTFDKDSTNQKRLRRSLNLNKDKQSAVTGKKRGRKSRSELLLLNNKKENSSNSTSKVKVPTEDNSLGKSDTFEPKQNKDVQQQKSESTSVEATNLNTTITETNAEVIPPNDNTLNKEVANKKKLIRRQSIPVVNTASDKKIKVTESILNYVVSPSKKISLEENKSNTASSVTSKSSEIKNINQTTSTENIKTLDTENSSAELEKTEKEISTDDDVVIIEKMCEEKTTHTESESSEPICTEKRQIEDLNPSAVSASVLQKQQTISQDDDIVENSQQFINEIKSATDSEKDRIQTTPTTIKVRSPRFYPNAIRGRAAQMLGLVTKEVVVELEKTYVTQKKDEDKVIKKDRILCFRDLEKLGSPSGSRQEKMFKNIREEFGSLKNDGEKISPKVHKLTNEDVEDVREDCSLAEESELPMLHWSSANPPSLTASPSVSILKRANQNIIDIDNETTPSKFKRVSFADPLVSKKMRYEVASPKSSARSGYSSLSRRRLTPYKIKDSKRRLIMTKSTDIPLEDLLVSTQPNNNNDDEAEQPFMETQGIHQNIEDDTINDSFSSQDTLDDIIPGTQEYILKKSVSKLRTVETLSDTIDMEDPKVNGLDESEKQILGNTMDVEMVIGSSVENLSESSAMTSTLPVTESIFEEAHYSLDSQNIQSVEKYDPSSPVYPNLKDCDEPVSRIITSLTNPLWTEHLRTVFMNRDIKTVGDLAILTEPEINRLPVKGGSKMTFVREVLQRFQKQLESEKINAQEVSQKEVSTVSRQIKDKDNILEMSQNIKEILNETDLLDQSKNKSMSNLILRDDTAVKDTSLKDFVNGLTDSQCELLVQETCKRLGIRRTMMKLSEVIETMMDSSKVTTNL